MKTILLTFLSCFLFHSLIIAQSSDEACISTYPPVELEAIVEISGVFLTWESIQGTVACHVQGKISTDARWRSYTHYASDPSSAFVSASELAGDNDYAWRVRCACSVEPDRIVTPFSAIDTFTYSLSEEKTAAPALVQGKEYSFQLAPNPASNTVSVTYPNQSKSTIKIYDFVGKLVKSHEMTGSTAVLDISKMETGIYSIFISGSGTETSERLVVSR